MRVIIVDDERLAIHHFEKVISQLDHKMVIDTFQNPYEALKKIQTERIDLAFIDIEMPELNGLELAEKIQQCSPETQIVFVTAYDEFAIQAFELNALDYILKPLQRDRLAKTIGRINERIGTATYSEIVPSTLLIRLFKTLEFEQKTENEQNQPFSVQWRTTKAQELFIYLLHHRNQIVHRDVLLEELWPDIDWKKATAQLYSTVYQVRKTLAAKEIKLTILSQDGGYQLDLGTVNLDVDIWEQGIHELNKKPSASSHLLSQQIQLFQLYRGDYLAAYDYFWAESERQRLKTLYFHHALQLIEQLSSSKRYAEAVDTAHRLQSLQPHMEESYFALMKLYSLVNDRTGVQQQYQQLEEMVNNQFDAQPDQAIQVWYHNWLNKTKV